jgi:D-serine deaminase-like pyridoxal phosphate-dependent protein
MQNMLTKIVICGSKPCQRISEGMAMCVDAEVKIQADSQALRLSDLATPCLVLDADRMDRNIARLRSHLSPMNVTLRPHLKTSKSIEVARRLMDKPGGPATVSTLKEARHFAAAGVTDLIYAVGISPDKLPSVLALRAQGVDLAILMDSREQAEFVAASARTATPQFKRKGCVG